MKKKNTEFVCKVCSKKFQRYGYFRSICAECHGNEYRVRLTYNIRMILDRLLYLKYNGETEESYPQQS